MSDKIKISFDDLNSSKVDDDLKRQDLLNRMHQHQQTVAANTTQAQMIQHAPRGGFFRNAIVYMFLFGLLGGILGWAGGEVAQYHTEQNDLYKLQNYFLPAIDYYRSQGYTEEQIDQIVLNAKEDPQLKGNFYLQENKTNAEKDAQAEKDEKAFKFYQRCWYITIAVCISVFLSCAESIMAKNWHQCLQNVILGIILGLIGGFVVSLFADKVYNYLQGDRSIEFSMARQVFARSVGWAILGLFVAIAPGILMRSWKKFALGLAGGLVGGLIGGLLFDLICNILNLQNAVMVARFVGITAFGTLAGAGTALLENVIKQGWLKIQAGLIAGKQFILYKNPTTIGSSPKCDVYLFKDPSVVGIHAAIHVRGGRYILCSQTGAVTLVNGTPVMEKTLKNGDMIQIGSTSILFETKKAES